MPRAHGGEDPGAKPEALLRLREPTDPAGVDLDLLPRLAIEHGDVFDTMLTTHQNRGDYCPILGAKGTTHQEGGVF